MLNLPKSDDACARLSVTTKLVSQRRWYPTSTDTRDSNCCCTDTPMFQSAGRTPHPFNSAGSYEVSNAACPNSRLLICPQLSPPTAVRFCASGFSRSQSVAKLLFASVHVRVVVVCSRDEGRWPT